MNWALKGPKVLECGHVYKKSKNSGSIPKCGPFVVVLGRLVVSDLDYILVVSDLDYILVVSNLDYILVVSDLDYILPVGPADGSVLMIRRHRSLL